MKRERKIHNRAIEFAIDFFEIAPVDLYELLEYLEDRGYLSEEGQKFYHEFWETFIKDNK